MAKEKVILKREAVAAKYKCNCDRDIVVICNGYNGKISNINEAGAAHLVSSKTGYLTPIVQEESPAAAPIITDEVIVPEGAGENLQADGDQEPKAKVKKKQEIAP